jgi:acyl carrier protein
MNRDETAQRIKKYIAENILDGKDIGLDEETPLLEWGIINSMEIARIVTFIQNQFSVEIPDEKINPQYFENIEAIVGLIHGL